MHPERWRKTPTETRNLVFDLTDALATGDTVDSAVASIVSEGGTDMSLTMFDGSVASNNDTSVTQKVTAGTDNEDYGLLITATTTSGEVISEALEIEVRSPLRKFNLE